MAEGQADTEKAAAPGGNSGRRLRIGAAVLVVLVVIAGVFWYRSRGRESTDDAQVDGRITPIAARVGGMIVKVNVDNNQQVNAGDVLVQIDPRDYQVAVDRAKAELADAQANGVAARTGVPIARIETGANINTATGSVDQARAGVSGAEQEVQVAQANLVAAQAHQRDKEATAVKAARDVDRLTPLVEKDEVSRQQFDAVVAAAASARAAADAAKSDAAAAQNSITAAEQRVAQARGAAEQARAGLETARTAPQQLQVTQARAAAADARVQQAQAALQQAELNLQYATLKAPTAGVVSRKAVEPGQVVQPGQPLMALVDLDHTWITANFVKVVQRIPVKLYLEPGEDPQHLLRPGMSVMPIVYVK